MNPLKIGNVIRVESGRVEVLITIQNLNLIHGDRTYRVGQLGSYVTIPMDDRTLVGFVTGTGRQDTVVVEVEPQLVMQLQLAGEIQGGRFVRGVTEYPIVGDDVWVAVHNDFEAIFGSFDQLLAGSKHPRSFSLGRFALNPEFTVKVLGSEFFAKHAAIVGNSGSGKSCTTAKILQEVLELDEAQVVLFDLHGEYPAAFSDEHGQPHANVTCLGVDDLVVPYWLLKYDELESLFVDRSNPLHISTQISFLRSALLEFKQDAAAELGLTKNLTLDTPIYFSLEKLKTYAENLNEARYVLNDDHLAFSQLALRSLDPVEQQKLMRTQRCRFNRGNPEGETPHPLYFDKLLGLIDHIDTKFQDRRYEFLLRPLEHGANSPYFKDHIHAEDSAGQTSGLMNHLIRILTGRIQPRSNLTIIDLSGIPFEIVDVTVAVLTRLLFDLNFWTPAGERHPILLVFEEAHNYIPRVDTGRSFAKKAVERVAKEGRKYGVSAMVVSQRPSELAETVLAQCNSLVVMRLSNPEDQHYIARVISDHFTGLLQMLPILRPGEAFVIGDSVLMPMRTLVDMPRPEPLSGDVDFFRHWSSELPVDQTDNIIDHWRRQDRQAINKGRTAAAARAATATAEPTADPPNQTPDAAQGPPPGGAPAIPRLPSKPAPVKASPRPKRQLRPAGATGLPIPGLPDSGK
ncbi:MAG: ATP-binding protein [Planctomycetes bacterium]|nr:ATP-binding protein [Planctomycetota bacterium]